MLRFVGRVLVVLMIFVAGVLLSEQVARAKDPAAKTAREEFLEKFDTDGDGKIDEDERTAAARARAAEAKSKLDERREQIVARFDFDGDGKLNAQERAAARQAAKNQPDPGNVGGAAAQPPMFPPQFGGGGGPQASQFTQVPGGFVRRHSVYGRALLGPSIPVGNGQMVLGPGGARFVPPILNGPNGPVVTGLPTLPNLPAVGNR